MKLASDPLRNIPRKVVEYTKPRPETAGDLPEPNSMSAGIGGGIQGYVVGGMAGGAAGVLGGYIGVKAGEKTDSMAIALGAGAATGAIATTALSLGLLAAQYPQLVSLGQGTLIAAGVAGVAGAIVGATRTPDLTPTERPGVFTAYGMSPTSNPTEVGQRTKNGLMGLAIGAGVATAGIALSQVAGHLNPMGLIAPAVLGGFVGAIGTLSGDRRASVRDSVYGGMLTGGVAAAISGNPVMVVAGAAAAGIGGRAVKPAGKIVLGTIAGAATGALAGFMSGQDLVNSAIMGALAGPTGALLGPPLRQVTRNATLDLTNAVNKKIDPWLAAHPLNKSQKVFLGATVGALSLGPLGLVAGWNGAAIAAGIGATIGGVKTYTFLNKLESSKLRDSEASNANTTVVVESQQASVSSLILRPSNGGTLVSGGLTNVAGMKPVIPSMNLAAVKP